MVRRVREVLSIPLEKYLLVPVEDRDILQLIRYLKSKFKLLKRPSSYRAVDTYHLGYKNQFMLYRAVCSEINTKHINMVWVKSNPWTVPESSRRLRLPDLMTMCT